MYRPCMHAPHQTDLSVLGHGLKIVMAEVENKRGRHVDCVCATAYR